MSRIFVNPAGQRDNLGDSVLRRPYLEALRDAGELHVLVGSDLDYASALGLTDSDVIYRSRLGWVRKAAMNLTIGRGVFAVNAGEVIGSTEQYRQAWWQGLLATLARWRHRPVVVSGVSIRPGTPLRLTRLAGIVSNASMVTWRDEHSRSAAGIGRVAPDWAFSTGGSKRATDVNRKRLAIALRGDRPEPPAEWYANVRELARTHNSELVVVVQVRRDRARARAVAARLNASLVDWQPQDDHAAQEVRVRELYRGCVGVISDRIHALILGVTEGAVALGTETVPGDKLRRTFAAVTALPVAPLHTSSDIERWGSLLADRERLLADVDVARDALRLLRAEIASVAR
jgi:hypothetical protein